MLVELVLYQFSDDLPVAFVEAVGSPPPAGVPVVDGIDSNIVWLNVSKQHLDAILLDITTLTCSKVYPYWTSKVYCQLTELHLMGSFPTPGIEENHFVNILNSSPDLRVLEFNLHITNTVPAEAFSSHNSISLRKLEILRLP
ncbi:hypothetical protein OPQ81_003983 [Rhizoctonia solani]|nr:hypothetical protein OPQ81_003983 [Rhizoctonia solani]